MQWLTEFLSANRKYVVLSVAVVLSLTMLSLKDGEQMALTLRGTPGGILQVGHRLFSWATRLAELSRENRYLRRQNLEFALELWALEEAKLENLRLRGLLGFREENPFSYVPARVVAHNAYGDLNSVRIDAGTEEGIAAGMPVVTTDGLVGRVFRASRSTSIVQLLLDRNSRVSAVVQNRGRTRGILAYNKGTCYLTNVSATSEIKVGDVVVSSGAGGVFPRGLRIGTVERLEVDSARLFPDVMIHPGVRFSHLEEVFVLVP